MSQQQRCQGSREGVPSPYPTQGNVQAQGWQHHTEAVRVSETTENIIRLSHSEERYHEERYYEEPLRRLAQGRAEYALMLQLQSASIPQASTHGRVQSSQRSQSPRSKEAAEALLLLAGSGLKTELPDSRQVLLSNDPFSHQHIDATATTSQLSLSQIGQHAHESASPLNLLATSTLESRMSDPSQLSTTNNQVPYQGSNATDAQPSLPEMDQHTSNHTSSSHEQAASSLSDVNFQQNSEIDVEQYLDGVQDRSEHNRNRRILEVLQNIYELPAGQRGNQLRNFVRCLELDQEKQDEYFDVLRRMLHDNRDASKERYLVTKWLLILVRHAQDEAIKARDAAKIAEQGKPKAPFCGEGFHKLKCGHYRASHEACGMSCYGRSTFPNKPLTFDAPMSEIVCFKCPY
ncbi:hypothetical protein KCU64_g6966, partial [Aureobasidium melanogenum]